MGDLFVSGTEKLKVKRVCRPLPASYQCSADKSLSVLMIGTQGVCVWSRDTVWLFLFWNMIAKACWYPIGLSEEQMDRVVSLNDQLGDIGVSSIVGYEQKTWKATHGKLFNESHPHMHRLRTDSAWWVFLTKTNKKVMLACHHHHLVEFGASSSLNQLSHMCSHVRWRWGSVYAWGGWQLCSEVRPPDSCFMKPNPLVVRWFRPLCKHKHRYIGLCQVKHPPYVFSSLIQWSNVTFLSLFFPLPILCVVLI